MYLLDTNVLSELMRPVVDRRVMDWFEAVDPGVCYTSAVCKGEILEGLLRLPDGARRDGLLLRAETLFSGLLAGRVVSFNEEAAKIYATLCAARRRLGRPIAIADAQIAASALGSNFTLVTRNVSDFLDGGLVATINPWSARSRPTGLGNKRM